MSDLRRLAAKATERAAHLHVYGVKPGLPARTPVTCACCHATAEHYVNDHDHACCARAPGCEHCHRGVICRPCNTRMAHYDAGDHSDAELQAYVARHHARIA